MSLSNEELKKFWDIANGLRKNLDAAEYKHIVLGLVFLKYISDSFEGRRIELEQEFSDKNGQRYKAAPDRRAAALEERDYYKEVNVFWVPVEARWDKIQANSKQPRIAEMIDEALLVIERENPKLEGILERKYSDAKLTPAELGAVVDLIGTMSFGKGRAQASDTLGQVYEYFLGMFASAEGKLGGQFYTTPSIVKTLVEVLQPTKGRVYDPCCGSGGMFVQSERFVEAHGGKLGEISIYGQESNPTTRRLCAMNLAIRGIDFNLGATHADTFLQDQHQDLRFDFILMNPPFGVNASYPREQLLDDVRWKKYGVPRAKPANYAWLSHAVHHLSPNGRAGIVMPHSSLTSTQGDDDKIRKAFVEDGIVECIVDLPGQLFFNTPIPSCLWFFSKKKKNAGQGSEDRILFIDARKMGSKVSKTQIEFSHDEIQRIANTYRAWSDGENPDVPGFSKSVPITEIGENQFSLSPGRYIGTEESEPEVHQDLKTSIAELTNELTGQFSTIRRLEQQVLGQLSEIGGVTDAAVDVVPGRSLSAVSSDFVNTLFKSWFVEFAPVISKADGSGDTGLSKAFLELFPSRLTDSQLGPIPERWEVCAADKLFDITIGRTPPRKESQWFTSGGNGVPWVSIRDMGRYVTFAGNTSEALTNEAIEKFRVPVVPADVVLMSFKLTVGKLCITTQPVATNEAIAHFQRRKDTYISPFYTYLWLQHFEFSTLDSTSSIGTATNSKLLKQIPFLVPSKEVMNAFDAVVKPFFELIRTLNLSSPDSAGEEAAGD